MNGFLTGAFLVLKFYIVAYAAYFFIFFLGPISYPFHPYIFVLLSIFFLGLLSGSFFIQLLPVKRKLFAPQSLNRNISNHLKYFHWLVFFTSIYLVVVIFDFLILGSVLEVGIVENRENATISSNLDGRRGSMLGLLNILLSGMPIILAVFLMLDTKWLIGRVRTRLGWLLVFTGIVSYTFSGGRNYIFITIMILGVVRFLSQHGEFKEKKTNFKRQIFVSVIALLSLIFFLYIFIARIELSGVSLLTPVYNMMSQWGVKIHVYQIDSYFMESIYVSIILLLFYFNHSLSAFSPYLNGSFQELTYGVLTFPLPVMLYDTIFGTSIYLQGTDLLRVNGLYLGMLGTLYIDFREVGIFLFSFFLGFFTTYFVKKTLAADPISLNYKLTISVSALFLSAILLSPVYNILAGNGFSVLIALIILYTCMKLHNLTMRRKNV